MMTEVPTDITLKYEVAKDLIQTKQDLLRSEIRKVLQKWNESSVDEFLNKVKVGDIEEGEHDAILLTNYLSELHELENLLS